MIIPESPVTGSNNVGKVEVYDVTDIVRLYREQEKIDVEQYFRGLDTIELFECRDTGYRFYHPFDVAGDEHFYQLLHKEAEQRGIGYDRDWDEDHKFGFRQIGPGQKVLEIGCNTGKFLNRLTSVAGKAVGLEFNSLARQAAQAKGLNVLGESIEAHASENKAAYDVVCSFQVFEHITKIGSVFEAVRRVLKPGGKLVISVPNNEPFFQRFNKYEVMNMPPHHVGLWNLAALERTAKYFDYELADLDYFGTRGAVVDAYLRAKLLADVRSLPINHSVLDKLKMLAVAPLTLSLSFFDRFIRGERNRAYINALLIKK